MWPSQHVAEWIFDIANVVLIVSLVAGAISTMAIVWTANRKEHYLKRDLAEANLRAAQAIERAEAERLARVKIEERLAPRSISSEQSKAIQEALQRHSNVSVDVMQYGETPEVHSFAHQLFVPLEQAGWKPRVWVVPGGGDLRGAMVAIADNGTEHEERAAAALLAALNAANVELHDQSLERFRRGGDWPSFVLGPPYDASKHAPIRLYLGAKP